MKYFSMFSGIGGFEAGIERAYKVVQRRVVEEDPLTPRYLPDLNCVGYSEIDKYAIQIYEKHFKHKNYGDATKINASELPDFDLLVGGFPCQAFSIAGKRKGFDDTRGTLFFDIARILKEKRPRYFLLENVKGLLSHDNGNTFKTILAALTELRYDIQWQILNSKNFGVPQNRERVFIIGHLRGTPRPQVFPLLGNESEDHVPTLRATYHKGYQTRGPMIAETINPRKADATQTYQQDRVYKTGGVLPAISSQLSGRFNIEEPVILQKSQDWREKGKLREFTEHSPTIRAEMGDNHPMVTRQPLRFLERNGKKVDGDYSFTVDTSNTGGVRISKTVRSGGRSSPHGSKQNWDSYEVEDKIRRLTPTECERLQGYPDGWTEKGIINTGEFDRSFRKIYTEVKVSDTQRYKTLGNSVTVNVIQAIMERLL